MVIRHHEEQRQKEERARREEQAKLRRIASTMAKDVRQFWSNVEKVGRTAWDGAGCLGFGWWVAW